MFEHGNMVNPRSRSKFLRVNPFTISRLPHIEFGSGSLSKLPVIARGYGTHAVLVTGSHSLRKTQHWHSLTTALKAQGITWHTIQVRGEPSTQLVDYVVRDLHDECFDEVIGVGGGSVLDTAKAIA